jgi:hypothetical protein
VSVSPDSKRKLLLLLIPYVLLAIITLDSIVQAEETPWRWIISGLAVGFFVLGAFSWVTSTRLSTRGRAAITTVTLLGAFMTVGLLEGFLDAELHGLALGIYMGYIVAVLVEKTMIPAQYRILIS